MSYTLLLRLAAPLQSWGSGSKLDIRRTDAYPTKSGVLGIIASALGRDREDDLSDLNTLKFGIRVDCPGNLIEDFQIARMGKGYNTGLSHRYYIADATFLAGIESDDLDFLQSIDDALKEPRYALYLGVRSCPPTAPLNLGIVHKPLYEALQDAEWQINKAYQKGILKTKGAVHLRIFTDTDDVTGDLVKDRPLTFSQKERKFGYRYRKERAPKIIREKRGA